jgi:2-phospho-L-lactate transferase/gluconeogenesis factor (CofD/UPF0052 family)
MATSIIERWSARSAADTVMRIAIIAGGTGPMALQQGLYDAIEKHIDGIEIKVLVNAYDNGLSTGTVRRVMNGKILGPSDVRKNQTTRLRLTDPSSPWLNFLDLRFSTASANAESLCHERTAKLADSLREQGRPVDFVPKLHEAIDEYFRWPRAREVMYEDFSLANVVYAGLCSRNEYSLRAAAHIMAQALAISDDVILNEDRSLFLGTITRSGRRIADEGDIVTWGDESDPFTDVFFLDEVGNEALPQLCFEAWQAMVEADLIILSSGTQWSSLIPTYASRGFKAAIRQSKARIVMVMNKAPDTDAPGQTASDIINTLVPRYFDEHRLHVVTDRNGHPIMRELDSVARAKVASFAAENLSQPTDAAQKHDSTLLANAIGHAYFNEYLHSDLFLFDYDDTLRGRNNSFPKSSRFNVRGLRLLNSLARVGICTGSSVRALELHDDDPTAFWLREDITTSLEVFADGGINQYSCGMDPKHHFVQLVQCVCEEALLPTTGPHSVQRIIDELTHGGIPREKIENRGNALIAIKPIEPAHRPALVSFVRNLLYGSDLEVRESGRTTVEIHNRALSKLSVLTHLSAGPNKPATITYVGDECECGNDHAIALLAKENSRVRCLPVTGPADTAFFIHALTSLLRDGTHR